MALSLLPSILKPASAFEIPLVLYRHIAAVYGGVLSPTVPENFLVTEGGETLKQILPYHPYPRFGLVIVLKKQNVQGIKRFLGLELAFMPENGETVHDNPYYTVHCVIRAHLSPEPKLDRWRVLLDFNLGDPFRNFNLVGWDRIPGPQITGEALTLAGDLAAGLPEYLPFTERDRVEFPEEERHPVKAP